MKSNRYFFSLLTSLLLSCSLFLSPNVFATTANYSVIGVNSGDVLNIRKYPGSKSKVIASIPSNGSSIKVLEKHITKGESTWTQIQWKDHKGWVNMYYLLPSSLSRQNSPTTRTKAVTGATTNTNAHTHPSNKCTRSITHNHANGKRDHKHRYSCKDNSAGTANPKTPVDINSHVHPSNKCTHSITHSHPNGKRTHKHRYSCKDNTSADTDAANSHKHPANKCTRSVTHSHPNGKRDHKHSYSCKDGNSTKEDPNAHLHPKQKCTNSVTHSHPNGKHDHTHKYSCKS